MTADAKNLRQRIAAVSKAAGQIKPSGRNQFNAAAISIDDVEEVIQPLLAEHGVVIRYTHIDAPIWMPDANPAAWLVHLMVITENANDPGDSFEGVTYDTGGNISAAVSFALKRYYKGVLHIGDEEDGQGAQTGGSRQTRVANGASPVNNGSGTPCPGCGKTEYVRKGANRQTGVAEWYCYKRLGGCGKTWPVDGALVAAGPPRQTSLVDDDIPPPPDSPY